MIHVWKLVFCIMLGPVGIIGSGHGGDLRFKGGEVYQAAVIHGFKTLDACMRRQAQIPTANWPKNWSGSLTNQRFSEISYCSDEGS